MPSGTVTATNTVYSYAIVDANSDSLSALVEGGATYLQNLATSSLYVPNLSDAGAIIPPQLLYSIENNRLVGDIHVNDTMCLPAPGSGLNCASNTQVVMNATEQMDYYVDNYAIGPGASWETLDAEYYGPLYGASLLTGAAAALTTPGNVLSFSYNSKPELGFIPLFEFYQAVSYISPMYLYLNASGYTSSAGGTASSLGYHRIIYTFEDTFGNKIVAPMDVDIAYPTTIRLSVVPNVDPSNENQTVLAINGIAGSYSNLGQTFTPLPAGETIYLYYDNNLNFVNYNPLTDPTDAVACAYSVNGLASQLDCTPSNPLYTGRTQNADVVSFRPAYNSIGACNPPPNSLLLNGYPQCNLYGIGALVRCPYSTAGTRNTACPYSPTAPASAPLSWGCSGRSRPAAAGASAIRSRCADTGRTR